MKLYVAYAYNILGDMILYDIWPTYELALTSAQEVLDGKEDNEMEWVASALELTAYDCWDVLSKAEDKHLTEDTLQKIRLFCTDAQDLLHWIETKDVTKKYVYDILQHIIKLTLEERYEVLAKLANESQELGLYEMDNPMIKDDPSGMKTALKSINKNFESAFRKAYAQTKAEKKDDSNNNGFTVTGTVDEITSEYIERCNKQVKDHGRD